MICESSSLIINVQGFVMWALYSKVNKVENDIMCAQSLKSTCSHLMPLILVQSYATDLGVIMQIGFSVNFKKITKNDCHFGSSQLIFHLKSNGPYWEWSWTIVT